MPDHTDLARDLRDKRRFDHIDALRQRVEELEKALGAADDLHNLAVKAVFDDGHEERLLIENWPLMDAIAKYREARALLAPDTTAEEVK